MKPFVLILLGAPGSGKGTQAERIGKELNLPHISTGELIREQIRLGSPYGLKIKDYVNQGLLVPDELILDVLFDRISQKDCEKGCVLDGFPRTVNQASELQKRLKDKANVVVINLEVNDDVIIERAAGRLMCKTCGNIQHLKFSPPKTPGVCDKCSGELYQRADDQPDVVKNRLKVYYEQTAPVAEFYEKLNLLVNLNGEDAPEVVFKEIINTIQLA